MNNIFSDNPTWAIGIAIGLFGLIAAHRLLMYRDKHNIFHNAAINFVNTIHNELRDIYPIPVNWPKNIDQFLREKFPVLQAAVNTFANTLPESERAGFLRAWSIYRLGEESREIDKQCYYQYMPFISTSIVNGKEITINTQSTYQETFNHNVSNLIKYAKQT